jgi:HTH-type transcriptional regulator / antitoxin HipB
MHDERLEVARDLYGPEDVGEVIRQLRKQKGWSQADLAEWLGVSRPTVISLERGRGSFALTQKAILLLGAKLTAAPKGSPR